ncbi:hippurate hydrolase [Actinacidiphila guanduensis]|uniref:Hippurate hydrolase n=1 Tax=Actinacidiphila guanduensis TaxID=310781 RepID=A0A1H0SCB7_9ACTN|nr:amidohydrolase [Actinacidiphila guanduensis]SDP39404.1 hippurate hydrolase [Actinacidiphila guanduensis]
MSDEAASTVPDVLAGLSGIRSDVEDWYRDLHSHPELGFGERRTSSLLAEHLRGWGFSVTGGIGGTGVVGVLANGDGHVVLLRAELDALPIREQTGLAYASRVTGSEGGTQAAMHACGHDVHMACLLGAARLLAQTPDVWQGTLVVLFQPSEENGAGARAMVADGLAELIPRPDVALAQHVFHAPASYVGIRPGLFLAAADTLRVVLHGRGAHGSQPEAAVDPVVLAAMVVLRLQTIVAREIAAADRAVVTVGSIRAGEGANIIPDAAELLINVWTFDEDVRTRVIEAIGRMVRAECQASRAPREPEIERLSSFPLTVNDSEVTERVAAAFGWHFGDAAGTADSLTPSDDFSDIPRALGAPSTFWVIGGTDPDAYAAAERAGTVAQDIPVNHSPRFAPVLQPTLDTGVRALVTAALAWLAPVTRSS